MLASELGNQKEVGMVSKCCMGEVIVIESETNYYACLTCFKACELTEVRDQSVQGSNDDNRNK